METTTKHRATYSPEDNKLRMYPTFRLPREEYDKLKTAGFSWAPKQELFVAPMWTPEREDLLIEFCGEIEDEDTSLVNRAEERAERFESYSDARLEDANQARELVSRITDGIPMGQPILIGHHSEKHARKDAERIENGMRKAVKAWETSKYWTQRAKGAIHAAKYKEQPSVRARRIKRIEADMRKSERAKEEAERLVRFWEGKLYAKNPTTGEKKLIEIRNDNRDFVCKMLGMMPNCGVRLTGLDGTGYYSAWDALQPDGERYRNCPTKTVEELRDAALKIQAGIIARRERWLSHYLNRLAYEKEMLAADGGTVADKTGPEKGGACRCWASPSGGWSYIQKVNKVSVTVLDNWRNGGANFTRNIPFDKLTAVMSAAEVQERRNAGLLIEREGGIGFTTRDISPPAEKVVIEKEPCAEFSPLVNGGDFRGSHCAKCGEVESGHKSSEASFQALKEASKAGVQVVSANQLFPTPPELAERLVELADIQPGNRVLEPSAGTGSIASKIATRTQGTLLCVELNPLLVSGLRRVGYVVECADFLERTGNDIGMFDRIVMNPPFERGADIKHIKHAMGFLNPGGKLVAICANGPRQQEELAPLGEWLELPAGSFKEQGTSVNTAIVVIEN